MPSTIEVMFAQNSSHIPVAKCLLLRTCQVNEVQFCSLGAYHGVTLPATSDDV